MNEQYYEQLLNIKTCGEQKVFNDSIHYHRYEPTSYFALNSLSKEYSFKENDSVIDFGCGKGRLNFYINYFFGSYVTGIEMNSYYCECIRSTMAAVPSGELSSIISTSNITGSANTALMMFSIFSFSLYVGIITTLSDLFILYYEIGRASCRERV